MSNQTQITQEIINNYSVNNAYAVEWEAWISVSMAVAAVPILGWLELGRSTHRPTIQWKLVFSPLNICIIMIGLANGLSNFFYYYSLSIEDPTVQLLFNDLADISLVMLYTALFFNNAFRGGPIFEALFPRVARWMKIYNYFFAAVQVTQLAMFLAVPFLKSPTSNNISFLTEQIGVGAVFLLEAFELFVSYCYIMYLWNISKASVMKKESDNPFRIISRIGIICNFFGLLWFLSFSVVYFAPLSTSTSILENNIWLFICGYMSLEPYIHVILQLWMKYSLQRRSEAVKATANTSKVNSKQSNNISEGVSNRLNTTVGSTKHALCNRAPSKNDTISAVKTQKKSKNLEN